MKKIMLMFSLLSSFAIIQGMDLTLQKTALYNSFSQKNLKKTAELFTAIDPQHKPQFYKESFDVLNEWQKKNERNSVKKMGTLLLGYAGAMTLVALSICNTTNPGIAVGGLTSIPFAYIQYNRMLANINEKLRQDEQFYKEVEQSLKYGEMESYAV